MTHKLEADSILLDFRNRKILSDIHIKCETGKITGLLGRNGEGKSSLMKIIYGSLNCQKSIRFDGITMLEAFKHSGLLLFLPQFHFIPKGISLKKIFKVFELEYTIFENEYPEFSSKYYSPINILSGGMQRIVEIYIVVKSKSQFAMLDEPFTHLNPLQIEKVKLLLLEEKQHKGLLITDHMYKHVIDISDSLYVLSNMKTNLIKNLNEIEALGYAKL